ncbi:Fusobacterium membrane protein [Capnocytophaga canimorsus]|nr:DKNYY domain-containing protein [Capnocytophaga canimorsus]CEN49458.1 Fusobacterium membrane protein [Capnocytophaga canimorsus]
MISQKNIKQLLMMALIALGVLVLLIVLALMNNLSQPNLATAQRIGSSIFYHHNTKIYAEVAGAGYLPVYGADPESFEVLEGINQSVGWDKNKVYCGNGVLDGMKGPVKALGNGLYSDGTTTYYCSFTAENIKTNMVLYFLKSAFYTLTGKKYSDYQYTTIKIDDTGKKFHPINDIYALSSDSTQFYYKGQLIQGAKARIFAIADATDYFSDGKQLFYQSKPLNATYSPDWASARYSAWGDFQVLYHKNGGQIFVDGKELNPNQPPYKVFSLSELYAQHLIFYDDDKVYAYNNQKKDVIEISKNSFDLGRFTEFSDGYFTDGKDILYFSSYEDWPQGRRNNYMGLRAFTTMLGKVKTSSSGAWTRWGNPKLNLWQKGDELYYFDTHGRGQYGFLSEKAKEGEIITGVYRVANHDALQTAIQHNNQLSDSEVEQLINDGVFIVAENEVLLSVTTKIKDDTSHLVFWVLIFGFAIAALVLYYLKFSKR